MTMVEQAATALDAARAAFADQDALAGAPQQDVVDLLALTADLSRLVDAQRVRLTGAVAERSRGADESPLSALLGARHAREAVGRAFGLRAREAAELLSLAAATSTSRTITGEAIEIPFPRVAAALDAGTLSLAQTRAIVGALAPVAGRADLTQLAWAEGCLVDEATHRERRLVPELLQTQAHAYVSVIDPDGVLPESERQRTLRSLRMRQLPDGTWYTVMRSPAESGSALKTVLDAFTAPRVVRFTDEPDDGDGAADAAVPVDDRSPEQKRHDALIAMVEAHAASGAAPVAGGEVPRLLFTGTIDAFDAYERNVDHPVRSLEIEHTHAIVPIETVERLLCNGVVQRAVTDSKGHVLELGRTVRLFSPAQRRALAAQYGGCATPGCGFPVAWTEAHHVVWWEHGGATDTANGILLCSHCHHEVHRGRLLVVGQPGDWRVVPQLRATYPYARGPHVELPPRVAGFASTSAAAASPPLAVRLPKPTRPARPPDLRTLQRPGRPSWPVVQHHPAVRAPIEVRLRRRVPRKGRGAKRRLASDLHRAPRSVVLRL